MSLHLDSSHTPRWLRALLEPGRAHIDRAMAIVLGIIGISLLFGVLRVIDGAISGGLRDLQAPRQGMAMPEPDRARHASNDAVGDGSPGVKKCTFVEVPSATADAISL